MNPDQLVDLITNRAAGAKRFIAAIAGPPASGKSTLAEELSRCIDARCGGPASAVVAMDGYHLDNAVLDSRGLRHRKGAPETFDANGFVRMMRRIADNDGPVSVPGFDRETDAVIEGVQLVGRNHRIILVEGNYLLLALKPWSETHPLFDLTVFLNPGIAEINERLVQRWLAHGLDAAAARRRAMSNDIPNAKHVLENSVEAELTILS